MYLNKQLWSVCLFVNSLSHSLFAGFMSVVFHDYKTNKEANAQVAAIKILLFRKWDSNIEAHTFLSVQRVMKRKQRKQYVPPYF